MQAGSPALHSSCCLRLRFGRTPLEVIGKVHDEAVRIVKLPDVRERFAGLGMEPVGDTPREFAQYIRSELAKYARVVKQSGARAE